MKNRKWDGAAIKRLRHRHNITQHELAYRLGCRQQTISEWETDQYSPKNAYQKLLNMMAHELAAEHMAKLESEEKKCEPESLTVSN